jgi:hypothetical protein
MNADPSDVLDCSNGPLPRSLEPRAYFNVNRSEFALWREDAIEYLNWCDDQGLTVLGFDLWVATQPGPTVVDGGEFEGDSAACRKAINAGEFVGATRDSVFNIWVQR